MLFEKESLGRAHLRIARPTDQLEQVVKFYRDCLGFQVLGEFRDHAGFDGVMLGHSGAGYHLEFTSQAGHSVGSAPSQDHLLVFYIPDSQQWQKTIAMVEAAGATAVRSYNPYWDKLGKTYEDPDGYRVVIHRSSWPN